MPCQLNPPLTPRRGNTLKVLAVCRISGDNQDIKSLADQEALLRGHVAAHFDGPTEWKVLATKGSGECTDRDELRQLDFHIAEKTFDLILTEDLGRICRRTHVMTVCEDAVSAKTRLIAINDRVDTGITAWRMGAMFATVRHEQYNEDTSARIKRSVRNRFSTEGLIKSVPYGYIKPPGVKTDVLVTKDPRAERVYDQWFDKLEQGASYSEVMDWLNAEKILPGPAVKSQRWSVGLVRNTTFNSILKGVRVHNKLVSERDNATGRHHSVKAPASQWLTRPTPHLAFIEAQRYDRVIALLRVRNANRRRKLVDGLDPRLGVSRKRTTWPGQHLTCGICGRLFYYGGDGRPDRLKCQGALTYQCWLGVACSGPRIVERVCEAVLAEVDALPEFDAIFLDQIREKSRLLHDQNLQSLADLNRLERDLTKQMENLIDHFTQGVVSPAIQEKFSRLEAERDQVRAQRESVRKRPAAVTDPPTMAQIKTKVAEAFANMARTSPEFNRLMHVLVPKLEVVPYLLCGKGEPVARLHFTLEAASLYADFDGLAHLGGPLRKELIVDLFNPPQRVAYREEVMRLRAAGFTKMAIAERTGITHTAVQAAVSFDASLKKAGLTDPYVRISELPDHFIKMCRHRHPRYNFNPLVSVQGKVKLEAEANQVIGLT